LYPWYLSGFPMPNPGTQLELITATQHTADSA
jgi:hypothetical protein